MRWILGLLCVFSLHAAEPHFSITRDELRQLRRCKSDSEICRRRKHGFRHLPVQPSQHFHIHTPVETYGRDHQHRHEGLEHSWFSCTPAQATVKAAYIGCFATIIAGLGASLIGVLASGAA